MFIQILQGRCTRKDELRAALQQWSEERGPTAPGWLGGTYGFTDDGLFVGVVRFESRDLAMENSRDPEQDAWWARTEKLFDGPVEIHDCDRVTLMLDGGSDSAGFVQVIRGRVDDPALLESNIGEMGVLIHQARPEVIGATFAVEPDGTFTETVAFTSEESAREGERRMSENDRVQELMEQWGKVTHDVTYLDLHEPWFVSRS